MTTCENVCWVFDIGICGHEVQGRHGQHRRSDRGIAHRASFRRAAHLLDHVDVDDSPRLKVKTPAAVGGPALLFASPRGTNLAA